MRWDNLKLVDPAPRDGMPLPLFDQGAVVRRFDTPEFRGITFYEVQAKSIINRVPEASRMPFRWTINPYRGCSHQCVYCLEGSTPILMADGRTKPLSDIVVGDRVYGTARQGAYRRYVMTEVLAHWSTTKPAYRVSLEDGTELIGSGDHRFLTERGWKFVTGTQSTGPLRRPHLTPNNRLLGTGRFAPSPEHNSEYRSGYLCGMIRGDGHLGTYSYARAGRVRDEQHRFRLALTDMEPLQRVREFLNERAIATHEFLFQAASGGRKAMYGLRNYSMKGVSAVQQIIQWPTHPSEDWSKGFLAGIFDAEGGHSGGILRISNKDPAILDMTSSAATRLGFSSVLEPPRPNGVRTIRLLGGLGEHLRFFQTVDPAITRKRGIEGWTIKNSAFRMVTSIAELGVDLPMYDITTGTGDFIANGVVSHNCFARNTHTYLDMDYGEDFNSQIVVKVNAPGLLRKELSAKKWQGEHIAMGTNVDPYQRAEGRYKLMRGIMEGLRDFANPFSILTKGSLILRDIDLLQQCAEVADVGTNVSVGFVDKEVWRSLEPGTPNPLKRLEVCRTLNDAGIPCGVLMAPIIPFLTDSPEQLAATVRAVADAHATHLTPIVLHLRTGAREWYLQWLADNHPDLVPRYQQLYARGAYAPKDYQAEITGRVHELARTYGVGQRGPKEARRIRERVAEGAGRLRYAQEPAEQLPLL